LIYLSFAAGRSLPVRGLFAALALAISDPISRSARWYPAVVSSLECPRMRLTFSRGTRRALAAQELR